MQGTFALTIQGRGFESKVSPGTLADNFLAFISIGYLVATIVAYVAIRSRSAQTRLKLSRIADLTFLISLGLTAAVALFMTFALEG